MFTVEQGTQAQEVVDAVLELDICAKQCCMCDEVDAGASISEPMTCWYEFSTKTNIWCESPSCVIECVVLPLEDDFVLLS